jgi:ABC-type nitrate/sulfonate/bicarbonate transport system substrate-binding protein
MITYSKLSLAPFFDKDGYSSEYLGMAPTSLIDALVAGDVEAILPVEPIATIALNQGVARELLDDPFSNVITPFPGGVSLIRTEFIKENPEAADAVVRSMNRAIFYIRSNPEDSLVILAKYTGFPVDLLRGANLGNLWQLDEIDKNSVQDLANILSDAELVEGEVNTMNLYYEPIK